jgi:hypothetical protein
MSPRTETVTELCAIQVKGGSAELSFGALKKSGDNVEWPEFAFTWLKSLATPLFLAHVSKDNTTIDLYSVWWLWWIFSRQNVNPFKVEFVLGEHGTGPDNQEEPKRSESEEGRGHGDGLTWTIDAGPPFLSVNATVFNNKNHADQLVAVLRHRIAVERLMLMRFLQFIPIFPAIFRHTTNTLEGVDVRAWSFWSPAPGENLGRLCDSFVPLLTNFGTHLQWQDNPIAHDFIPILDWLHQHGALDGMAIGLLNGLRETHSQNLSPAHFIRQSQQQLPVVPVSPGPQ